MKKCKYCRVEILEGQLVCPHCGRSQGRLRRVRCRYCGALNSQGLAVCPQCGERLRQDWLRPALAGTFLLAAVVLAVLVGPRLLRGLESFRPAHAVGTVKAMVSDVPVLVKVPTLTPSLTPSITPSPTATPTSTPRPSATPVPTLTPTATPTPTAVPTDTPSPTVTQTRRSATPTLPPPTATPVPLVAAPVLLEPETESTFGGTSIFRLAWQSSHTLGADECFLLTVRYVQGGSEVELAMCLQANYWWVDQGLYLQADQETGREYHWRVLVARKATDADGNVSYVPVGLASEEWTFYWR